MNIVARNMEAVIVAALGLIIVDGAASVAMAKKAPQPVVASYVVNDSGSTIKVTARRMNTVQKMLAA